jgi:hypothetical protein
MSRPVPADRGGCRGLESLLPLASPGGHVNDDARALDRGARGASWSRASARVSASAVRARPCPHLDDVDATTGRLGPAADLGESEPHARRVLTTEDAMS